MRAQRVLSARASGATIAWGDRVAVRGDRIQAIGKDEEILALKGMDTKVIDLGGRFVMPGFNDAHVHFVDGGRQLDNVNLKDAGTQQEFARRIGPRACALGGALRS